ncbi:MULTISPECIES: transcription antitermination factor NusB [Dictyoglomus]|jgi:N utilization substance protein B|uniref:Transcription antitermination protein NusB n=1 Tax=Dictyoglomus turgidum (strain DSM 6724 / Z-1310) TaxID=515635 RepID=NUSB_DICTD|nr:MULTISPECIES: transcription antitermination factor NusB [Dictyoglomus]B8E246.1 RecName: Full=Transcription antitermination protein NusB; AltName: Full=Antitermination factor NusB [Dictyoglomus turgidum DSM 6724]ACK42323.1 NusB antitermination factor [Dictyoglomus turgidum DSM 6724]PNV80784.1 MAG: N utilization substance protein B [Dictyoglomus turgidum]HBU32222.1 transcription antitermination factor NusB [Dictyoglomus sp.]
MSKERTRCREKVLEFLFQKDLGQEIEVDFSDFSPQGQVFAYKLYDGALYYKDLADEIISKFSKNWKLERIGTIEKNILRMAIAEMFTFSDIPQGVTVNEAVELAKKYVSPEAGRFINGILRNIVRNWDEVKKLKEGFVDVTSEN